MVFPLFWIKVKYSRLIEQDMLSLVFRIIAVQMKFIWLPSRFLFVVIDFFMSEGGGDECSQDK